MTDVFAALADPTRRHLSKRLRGESSVTALAADLPVTRQAVSKHLAALREAGLVTRGARPRDALPARRLRRSTRPSSGSFASAASGTPVWSGCAGTSYNRAVPEILSCALDVAPLHAEPDASSEQVTQALRGEPLSWPSGATAGRA